MRWSWLSSFFLLVKNGQADSSSSTKNQEFFCTAEKIGVEISMKKPGVGSTKYCQRTSRNRSFSQLPLSIFCSLKNTMHLSGQKAVTGAWGGRHGFKAFNPVLLTTHQRQAGVLAATFFLFFLLLLFKIFGCTGSSLLHSGFVELWWAGAIL